MKKILIAEDSHDQIKILEAIFKKTQYEVSFATNGKDALEIIELNKFDLLITDIMMPIMSGFELLQQMKSKNLSVPTLVLTSKQREEDILKGLNFGIEDYIIKPFSPAVLLTKAKRILE